jgi:hypothetical protein
MKKISLLDSTVNESFDDMTTDEICKKLGLKNYTINSDNTVDVIGNVD